jgi:AcrR family transcriptional regulator
VALRLFDERGFKAVTVRDIMEVQGLTAGAMYNHFRSKDLMLVSLISDSVGGLETYLQVAFSVSEPDDRPARLAALAYAHARYQCEYAPLARVSSNEFVHLPAKAKRELVPRLLRIRLHQVGVTTEGIKRGEFTIDNPEIAVMEFQGMAAKMSNGTTSKDRSIRRGCPGITPLSSCGSWEEKRRTRCSMRSTMHSGQVLFAPSGTTWKLWCEVAFDVQRRPKASVSNEALSAIEPNSRWTRPC